MSFVSVGIAIGVGAASGGIMSAINGQPVWKGMLIGAGTGAVGGGIGAGLGALGGGAGGAGGGAASGSAAGAMGGIKGVGASFIEQAAQQGIGALPNASPAVGSTVSNLASAATPTLNAAAAPAATSALGGGFTGLGNVGDFLAKELGTNVLQTGAEGIGQSIANAQTEEESDKVHQQYFGGFAVGGPVKLAAKEGGSISLRGGDYVVPADVVSALGNGSSKAGAKYLTHLCNSLDAGPAPEAGALARARAYV